MRSYVVHAASLILLAALFATTPAVAQNSDSKAILVLDASGSMWGRIDDRPKIEIAREVIDGLLRAWDPSVQLGITVYGHREKGNCRDIETVVPVGAVDAAQIMGVVNRIKPKG